MTSLSFKEKCNKNKDCSSNICEMVYQDGKPKRKILMDGDGQKYTKECDFPRDCLSNQCVKIFNDKGQFITKKMFKGSKTNKS